MKIKFFENNERKRKILIMGKKGLVDDLVFWIFRILLIMLISFALVFFINSVISKNLETGKLELHLIAARIINSPYCLAMSENVEVYEAAEYNVIRIYPGKILLKNYDEDFLKKNCIITLQDANVGVNITISGMEPKYINKGYYEDIEPLTFSSKYEKVTRVFPVLVYGADGKAVSKTVQISVVAKKR